MKFGQLSIKARLILSFLTVGLLPMVASNGVSYYLSSRQIENEAHDEVKVIAAERIDEIKSYFDNEASDLLDLVASPTTAQAMKELSAPFAKELNLNAEALARYRSLVGKYYKDEFAPMYKEKSGKALDIEGMMQKLDGLSLAAQYDFVVNNPNPIGKKNQMDVALRDSPYAQAHTKYHSFFKGYAARHELYDVFLINPEGRVVYSAFKEMDFATSLSHGPWASSGLARAFESSSRLEAGKVHLEDLSPYGPSMEKPSAFLSTGLYHDGKFIGSLMIQLSYERITSATNNRSGLGQNGEVLVIGADGKLRTNTFRHKDTHTVDAAFAEGSKIDVNSPAVMKAKSGETGFMENVSYDGLKTIAYYTSVKLQDTTWYVVTELDQSEVYQSLYSLTYSLMAILLICMVVNVVFSLWFGSGVANNLKGIAGVLSLSSQEVSNASRSSASSATELSEAATEQAASLQETMASIEEISAMVNQNAESAQKANLAVDSNQKSTEEGSKSVDEMLHAIGDIKQTNDQILAQMETSNKEFAEIVKIISEIGTKTNVINEIVFQTKLLSFNASVEAARAGEHGKGFAVVAEEVGNLAQMSGNAAKEITDMLTDSIKKVNEIVDQTKSKVDHLVEVGKDKIVMGQSTAQKCHQALVKITDNARNVASMIAEISHASKEQAQGVQEINKAISQLDQVTQQNSAVAQQSSTQAESLNAEAVALSSAVMKLTVFVDGNSQPSPNDLGPQPHIRKMVAMEPSSVVPIRKEKKSKKSAVKNQKRVSGDDFVPSSADPNFEEF